MEARSTRSRSVHSPFACPGSWLAVGSVPAMLVSSAVAQTVVTGGAPPTEISAAALEAAGTLSFVQGDGKAGVLKLTSSGPFTNSWSMADAIGIFNLQGNSLTISSAVLHAGNVATGTCSIGVQNGTLTLGQNSFLTGFAGTLVASSLGTIVIEQGDWLTATTAVELNSNAGTSTLTWAGSTAATYAGALTLSIGATPGEVVVSTTQDTGTLALTGVVSGDSDLRLQHGTGVTATPTITLGLTGGFTGRTIIDTANVRIDTQASIGSAGLTLDGATLTAGAALSIGASQTLVVDTGSTIVGAGGLTALTIDGEMQGSGNLTLDAMDVTINGATSTYAGAVALRGGFELTVSNAAWLGSATGLSLNADGAATTFTWDSADDAAFAGTLDVGTGGIATVATTQDTGSITLSGVVSGTGDLRLLHTGVSADPTIILALTGGFTGQTIIDTANVRIDTQASIGSTGLTLDLATLTAGTDLTLGASQNLVVSDTSTIVGTGTGGALTALTVDGEMQGAGNLTLDAMTMTVNGTTSTFTGGVTMGTGSSLATGNAAWVEGLGALRFDASATVDYTGTADVTYDGLLGLSTNPATPSDATIRASGAGAGDVTLSGVASGTGNLIVGNTAGSTAAFTLALTGGFDGTTTVNDADVAINTQGSIGLDGLSLNTSTAMDATVGAPLVFGSAQLLTIGDTVNMSGSVASAAINAQGGLHSSAGATLNLDDIDLTVGDGTASTFTGDVSLTDGATLTLDGADLGLADLTSITGGAEVTFGGVGTIGSIGGPSGFEGRLELGDRGVSASSVLNVAGNASLASTSTLQSHFLSASGGTGIADQLLVGGTFTAVAAGATSATASLVFDPTVFDSSGGNWIPTPGVTDTYTVVSATGGFNGTFGTVNVVTIDPVTGLPTTRTLNQSGETRFLGAGFTVDYTGTAFSVSILGIGGPDPLPVPGTTNTNVIVPVQVGATTINRNANVGTVQNQQINQSAAAMNLLAQTSTGDTDFVATQLLLQTRW